MISAICSGSVSMLQRKIKGKKCDNMEKDSKQQRSIGERQEAEK